MKISKKMRYAIKIAVEEYGTLESFAKAVGSSNQNIHRYISGKIKSITIPQFVKIYPHIKKYLDEEEKKRIEFIAGFEADPDQLKALNIKESQLIGNITINGNNNNVINIYEKRIADTEKAIITNKHIPAEEKLNLIRILKGFSDSGSINIMFILQNLFGAFIFGVTFVSLSTKYPVHIAFTSSLCIPLIPLTATVLYYKFIRIKK